MPQGTDMKTPITIGLGLCAALLAGVAPAQRPQKSQEELTAQRQDKLAKPVFKKAPWIADYDAAREKAKKDGKPIFAYFTRSYAA
jgi:hypothetical protein